MFDDARAVIDDFYAAWQRQDIPSVLALCTDDIRYAVYQSQPAKYRSHVHHGRCEVSAYLLAMCAAWEFVSIKPGKLRFEDDGSIVHEMVDCTTIHRASGQLFTCRKRHRWKLRGNLVACCEEFEDTGLVRAFLDLHANA